MEVTQQKFTKEGLNLSGYLFKINDTNYVVTCTSQDDMDVTDESNPVNQIITSLAGGEETSE